MAVVNYCAIYHLVMAFLYLFIAMNRFGVVSK